MKSDGLYHIWYRGNRMTASSPPLHCFISIFSRPSSTGQIYSSSSSSMLPWFSFSLFPRSISHSLHVSVHQLPKPCSTSFTHHASVQRLSFTAVYNKLRSSSGEAAWCSLALCDAHFFCTVIPGFEREGGRESNSLKFVLDMCCQLC